MHVVLVMKIYDLISSAKNGNHRPLVDLDLIRDETELKSNLALTRI